MAPPLADLTTVPPDALARLKARFRALRARTEAQAGPCPLPHWFAAVEALPDAEPLTRCAVEWRRVVAEALAEETAERSEEPRVPKTEENTNGSRDAIQDRRR